MECFHDVDRASAFADAKMKKNNLFTTDRMFCDVYCFEPGQEQSPHSHDGSDKIYYVVEGAGTIRIGSEERVVEAGGVVLAPAGEPHGVVNHGSNRLRLLVFMAPLP